MLHRGGSDWGQVSLMRAMEVRQLQSHMQSDPGRFWLPRAAGYRIES